MTDETRLAIQDNSNIVRPADLTQVADAMRMFEEAKRQVLRDDDIQKISGKDFVKKSGWRRLARAFTLSTEIRDRSIERNEEGRVTSAEFIVRASHPNGAYADGWGGCDRFERTFNKDQDIVATAQTRATNRAISDLIAGGEVSADEMGSDGEVTHQRQRSATPPRQTPAATPAKIQKLQQVLFPGLGSWPPKQYKDGQQTNYNISIPNWTTPFRLKKDGTPSGAPGFLKGLASELGYSTDEYRHGLFKALYLAFGFDGPVHTDEMTAGQGAFLKNCLDHPNFLKLDPGQRPPFIRPETAPPDDIGAKEAAAMAEETGELDLTPEPGWEDDPAADGDLEEDENFI